MRLAAGGDLRKPLERPFGGTVRMQVNGVSTALLQEQGLPADTPDNRIVGTALGLANASPDDGPVLVVSNDTALRLTAAAVGLAADRAQPTRSWCRRMRARRDGSHSTRRRRSSMRCSTRTKCPVDDVVGASDLAENTFAVLRSGTSSALARVRAGQLNLLENSRARMGAQGRQQRAALRTRPVVGRRGQSHRARRSGRHRKDVVCGRRRLAHGRRAAQVRAAVGLPSGDSGRSCRSRLLAGHARRKDRPVDGSDHRRRCCVVR